jgi:branched-subunit amino acid ABC-type transport system permease component
MYRAVFYLGAFMLVLSILGLVLPHQLVITIFLPGGTTAVGCVCLAGILLYFALFGTLRKRPFKICFGTLGLALIMIALIDLINPASLGTIQNFVRIADLVPLIVGGLGYLVAGLEVEREGIGGRLIIIYKRYIEQKRADREWRMNPL